MKDAAFIRILQVCFGLHYHPSPFFLVPSQLVSSSAFLPEQASFWAERPLLPPMDWPPVDKYRGDGWVSRSDGRWPMAEAWFHALACSQAAITQLLGSNHSAPRLLRGALKSEARVWLIAEIFIPKYFCTYIDRIKETWIIDLADGRIWVTQWYEVGRGLVCHPCKSQRAGCLRVWWRVVYATANLKRIIDNAKEKH